MKLEELRAKAKKGIVFSTALVEAIVAGQKTQTRRLLSRQIPPNVGSVEGNFGTDEAPKHQIPDTFLPTGSA